MKQIRYSMQGFMDTAVRRSDEARHLVGADRRARRCDGAVTCALLAAECALKATLLFGYAVQYEDQVPAQVRKQAFQGSTGHDLSLLYQLQPPSVRMKPPPVEAIIRLAQRHRYAHRYGQQSPPQKEAENVTNDADKVVQWMKGVIG